MHALQTAVIEHTNATGVHHDWLIEDPRLPHPQAQSARLWTARVAPAPQIWAALGRFQLDTIPPHRRAYLDYQGPISDGRGRVRRVARGECTPHLWSEDRITLDVAFQGQTLGVELVRIGPARWRGLAWPAQAAAPA